MKRKSVISIYDLFIMLIAIISVILVILDLVNVISIDMPPFNYIDTIIWVIFVINYFAGLLLAKNRTKYFRTHIFDLLAIIPLSYLFSLFKFAKIFRLLRLIGIISIFRETLQSLINLNKHK